MKTFSDVLTALQLTSAALQCVAHLLPEDEQHKITFTGKWVRFGTLSVEEILNRADAALEPKAEG